MNTLTEKKDQDRSRSYAVVLRMAPQNTPSVPLLPDNRPVSVVQRKQKNMLNNSPQVKQASQLQAMADKYSTNLGNVSGRSGNTSGLPDKLKSGIENLSGYLMDDVKVHYNSSKPAQLKAHAYAQGSDIYLASGQDQHLPHEAWHVVQQKQGRVKPTVQLKKTHINDDESLEKEADVMGAKALSAFDNKISSNSSVGSLKSGNNTSVIGSSLFSVDQAEEGILSLPATK